MLSKEHIRLVQYLSASRELEIKETWTGVKIGQTFELSRFLFIVSDLDYMTDSISTLLKLDENQGTQKLEDSVVIFHIFYIVLIKVLEKNHNRLYIKAQTAFNISRVRYIPKCFSFKNIHINLG